jgi:hypothetical protein
MVRTKYLNPDDCGIDGKTFHWAKLKREWPDGMRFEDGPTERVVDTQMPLPEPRYTPARFGVGGGERPVLRAARTALLYRKRIKG